MKLWIYVEAREVGDGDDAVVSFNHCIVTAEDEGAAYFVGSTREIGLKNYLDRSGHASGQFLNDYVIPLDELTPEVTVMISGYDDGTGIQAERAYLHPSRAALDMQLFENDHGKRRRLETVRLICGDDK